MRLDEIYAKTEKGREEIQSRTFKLAPLLRTLLIMTDGHTKAGQILKQVAPLGVTAEAIERLQADGFITVEQQPEIVAQAPDATAASERKRFSVAQQFMNESSVNASGLRSFMLTLKLEKSQNLSDLRALLPDYVKLIEKGSGGVEAEVLIKKAKELLA